jgi:hypothetical protein
MGSNLILKVTISSIFSLWTGKHDLLWLVIFADYSEANAIDRILLLIGRESLSSGFDRIFLFDVDQHKTYSIK